MPKPATLTEQDKVYTWREQRIAELGYQPEIAEVCALAEVDWHALERIVLLGCQSTSRSASLRNQRVTYTSSTRATVRPPWYLPTDDDQGLGRTREPRRPIQPTLTSGATLPIPPTQHDDTGRPLIEDTHP